MSTDVEPADAATLSERVDALEAELADVEPGAVDATGTATVIATKGTLDMAFQRTATSDVQRLV